ncbi:MAG TPA: hypothetical protein VLH79_05490 [Chthonomonadales bacterium]|nr:hypothetical protein [Chthonomonadales bacterium]
MTPAELPLPRRLVAGDHFHAACEATHHAADILQRGCNMSGRMRADLPRADTQRLVDSLTQALCAARALDNLLAGNPPPKRGE